MSVFLYAGRADSIELAKVRGVSRVSCMRVAQLRS
jgi:hypothetical protein